MYSTQPVLLIISPTNARITIIQRYIDAQVQDFE